MSGKTKRASAGKMLRDVIAASYRRRYFRLYREYLDQIEDPEERDHEAEAIWSGLWPLALYCAEGRAQS